MVVNIQLRRDLAYEWTSVNPLLAQGEMGVELDTDLFKIGDGVVYWNDLPYGGLKGTDGTDGTDGQGVPLGGTTDQILKKTSADDYDTTWVNGVLNPVKANIDFANFDLTNVKGITFKDGQEITWNATDLTLDIPTGLGPVMQVGQEMYILVRNDTGSTITDGKAVRVDGVSSGYQQIVLAKADTFVGLGNGVLMTTMEIPTNTVGIVMRTGKLRGIDTSGYDSGKPLYLSATTAGELTNTSPPFPAYEIFIGGTITVDATDGIINVNVRRSKEDTFENFFNGIMRENLKFLVTSDGTDITGSLSAGDGSDNLTMICSEGFKLLDVSTPVTVALTAGTDATPQLNYIYILCSTSVLTVSTGGFPAVEHIKVAKVLLQTATYTQTYGALKNQNINNDLADTDSGHVVHIGTKIRSLPATWVSGATGSLSVSVDPSDVYFSNNEGKLLQMHEQTFPAYDMATGKSAFIVNDPTTAYKPVTNLNTITETSLGDSLNGDWFNLVVWGVINKTGTASQIMVNLPSKSYGKEKDALKNKDGGDVYTIPSSFTGVGFLIGRYTVKKNGTDWDYNSTTGYLDLRGFVPNTTAGSGVGSSGVTEFTGLDDTPSAYTDKAGYIAQVNSGETALEFTSLGVKAEVAVTSNKTLAIADRNILQVVNIASGTITLPTPTEALDGSLFYVVNKNASDLTITLAVGVDSLKEGESAIFQVSYANTANYCLASYQAGGGGYTNYTLLGAVDVVGTTTDTIEFLGTDILSADYDYIEFRMIFLGFDSNTTCRALLKDVNGYREDSYKYSLIADADTNTAPSYEASSTGTYIPLSKYTSILPMKAGKFRLFGYADTVNRTSWTMDIDNIYNIHEHSHGHYYSTRVITGIKFYPDGAGQYFADGVRIEAWGYKGTE